MSDGHWRFCEIIERTRIPGPAIRTPPETEKVVLEQHTDSGEYRLRPLDEVLEAAHDNA